MKAGRELDTLVAEKVMGFKLVAEEVEIGTPMHELFRAPNGRGYYHYQLPRYSTNIADAWEVVEKLGRWRGFDFMLVMPDPEQTFHLHTYEAGWYEATNDGPERRVVSDADTAPLAICLAALQAVSQEGQG